jgi:hypothetical protein
MANTSLARALAGASPVAGIHRENLRIVPRSRQVHHDITRLHSMDRGQWEHSGNELLQKDVGFMNTAK